MSNAKKDDRIVALNQVSSYLVSKDWLQQEHLGQVATIWRREDDSNAEVVLPITEALKDFKARIADAIEAIAEHEKRPAADVLGDVTRTSADLISVRVIHEDTSEGTIPINDGVLLVHRARDLLKSAALALHVKRRQFSGHPSDEVKAYLDLLRLGQTEVGSYVVNVFAPVPVVRSSDVEKDEDEVPPVPVAAAVTAGLAASLSALVTATERYRESQDLTHFDVAVQRGASSNLCDALLGLSGQEKKRAFEVKISAVRSPMFDGVTQVFKFNTEKVALLATASEYYKDNYVLPDRTVTGLIKRLDRPVGSEMGTVTVAARIGDQDKHIAIELGPDDYDLAITAHKQNENVSCSGDIHVTPRTARLMGPSGFRVLHNGELF